MAIAKSSIGIFGGSFDPTHVGHLMIAEQARQELSLDKVIFVPAFIAPHKANGTSAAAEHRMRMLRLAIKGNSSFKVSAIELERKGISYTVDTLAGLQRQFPRAELFLIIGSDNLRDFQSWKSPREILMMARLAVYERRSDKKTSSPDVSLPPAIQLNGEFIDVSSTAIRTRIRQEKSIRYLVPDAVEKYIKDHRLYRKQL
ncbi:MAG: nicotinate (nicotinamide) nucleotide adenylyltransferase [Bacteroidota bacterium]